jgi:hypothetical protein
LLFFFYLTLIARLFIFQMAMEFAKTVPIETGLMTPTP